MRIINPAIHRIIEERKELRLNLGAGGSSREGYFSVDLVELPGVDIVADLNDPLSQLPDGCVSAIYSRAAFEHVRNFIGLMVEIDRICASGAAIQIVVPHFSNPYYYSDPTHVQPFGLYTMHYFLDEQSQTGRKVPNYYVRSRFNLHRIKIDFYREKLLDKLLEPMVSRLTNLCINSQDIYERRFCYLYPAWQITYTMSKK